jgi:tetratricopeptide (TPR) repeat protein
MKIPIWGGRGLGEGDKKIPQVGDQPGGFYFIAVYAIVILAKIFNGKIFKSIDLEKYGQAQESYRKALKILGDKKFSPSWITLLNVAILRAKVLQREAEGFRDDLSKSFAANKNRGFSGWIAQYIAEILLNQDSGDIQEAEAWAKKALLLHQENGMRLLQGRDYLLHAELQKRRENMNGAKEHLLQAIEIFQECGANGYLQKAKKEWIHLSSLSF